VKRTEPHKTFCCLKNIFLQDSSRIFGGIFANQGGEYGDSEYLLMHSHWIMQAA
jgi:hypothetical protein